MVAVTSHQLSVAGMTYTPTKQMAMLVPTALSPASVSYGADTCSDHPKPAAMNGRLFIPADYAGFYPTLNDRVNYSIAGTPGNADVFRGRIDAITILDAEGFEPAAVVPQSRNIGATSGWVTRHGTLAAPGVLAPIVAPAGGNRVGMVTNAVVWPNNSYGTITTPATPVTAGESYVFTALAYMANFDIQVKFSWYGTGGALLSSVTVGSGYIYAKNDEWLPLVTSPALAPAGAVTVRMGVQLPSWTEGGPIHLDTVNLVTTAQAKKRPAGRHFSFTASDITATAARLMIGGLPFPAEPAADRVQRINALVPRDVINFQIQGLETTGLEYRDIDNQSSLTVFQRVANSIGNVAMADPQFETLIITAKPPRSPLSLEVVAGNPVLVEDPDLVKVPAGCIEHGALSTSITGLSNSVQFNYRTATPEGSEDASETVLNPDSIQNYGPMARSIDTDLPAPAGRAWQNAQRIVTAQSRPLYRLADQAKVVVKQLPASGPSMDLFGAMEGFRRLVHIPDAPEIIGHYHRVHGAAMTFGKETTLALDLEPADLIPATSVTFYDISRPPYDHMPFPKFTALTFADMANASRAAGF